MERQRIREPSSPARGDRRLLTCGRGQRIASSPDRGRQEHLLGEVAKGSQSTNVIAIGERGREVAPFSKMFAGRHGPVGRGSDANKSAHACGEIAIATATIREMHLFVDSLTRLARAQREWVALELEQPRLHAERVRYPGEHRERLGDAAVGGITALLTVLVDGGDMDEPIADYVRGLVDGHIVLDRKLAERGFYPAIDVSRSISRVATDVVDKQQAQAARKLRAILATYADVQDLIRIGAYVRGSNAQVDKAIELMPHVEKFLKQDVGDRSTFEQTRQGLFKLANEWKF